MPISLAHRFIPFALAAASALLFAWTAPTAAAEKIKIEYWTWDPTIQEITVAMAEAFMQLHPHIEVEVLTQPWQDYWDKLAILNADQSPPDVYNMSVAYAWDYANEGLIYNLEPFLAELPRDEYFFTIMDDLRYPTRRDDLYAFPFGWVASVLFHNRELFDQAGQVYPDETWDWFTLREVAKKLTRDVNGDGVNEVWGFLSGSNHELLDSVVYSWGGAVLDESQRKSLLHHEKSVEAIQFLVDLIHVDQAAPPPGVAASFLNGQVAMQVTNSVLINRIVDSAPELDWGITMVPKGPERRVIYGGPDSVAISKYTKHPEAAWEFVKFLIGPNRPVGSDVRGRVPINRKLALDPAWIEWSGGLERGVATLYESAPWVRGADFGTTKWMEWRVSAMNQALAPAFAAQSSVEEAARKASEAIDVILNTTVCRACP